MFTKALPFQVVMNFPPKVGMADIYRPPACEELEDESCEQALHGECEPAQPTRRMTHCLVT